MPEIGTVIKEIGEEIAKPELVPVVGLLSRASISPLLVATSMSRESVLQKSGSKMSASENNDRAAPRKNRSQSTGENICRNYHNKEMNNLDHIQQHRSSIIRQEEFGLLPIQHEDILTDHQHQQGSPVWPEEVSHEAKPWPKVCHQHQGDEKTKGESLNQDESATTGKTKMNVIASTVEKVDDPGGSKAEVPGRRSATRTNKPKFEVNILKTVPALSVNIAECSGYGSTIVEDWGTRTRAIDSPMNNSAPNCGTDEECLPAGWKATITCQKSSPVIENTVGFSRTKVVLSPQLPDMFGITGKGKETLYQHQQDRLFMFSQEDHQSLLSLESTDPYANSHLQVQILREFDYKDTAYLITGATKTFRSAEVGEVFDPVHGHSTTTTPPDPPIPVGWIWIDATNLPVGWIWIDATNLPMGWIWIDATNLPVGWMTQSGTEITCQQPLLHNKSAESAGISTRDSHTTPKMTTTFIPSNVEDCNHGQHSVLLYVSYQWVTEELMLSREQLEMTNYSIVCREITLHSSYVITEAIPSTACREVNLLPRSMNVIIHHITRGHGLGVIRQGETIQIQIIKNASYVARDHIPLIHRGHKVCQGDQSRYLLEVLNHADGQHQGVQRVDNIEPAHGPVGNGSEVPSHPVQDKVPQGDLGCQCNIERVHEDVPQVGGAVQSHQLCPQEPQLPHEQLHTGYTRDAQQEVAGDAREKGGGGHYSLQSWQILGCRELHANSPNPRSVKVNVKDRESGKDEVTETGFITAPTCNEEQEERTINMLSSKGLNSIGSEMDSAVEVARNPEEQAARNPVEQAVEVGGIETVDQGTVDEPGAGCNDSRHIPPHFSGEAGHDDLLYGGGHHHVLDVHTEPEHELHRGLQSHETAQVQVKGDLCHTLQSYVVVQSHGDVDDLCGVDGDTHSDGDGLRHHGESVAVCGDEHLDGEDNDTVHATSPLHATEQLQQHLSLMISQASLMHPRKTVLIIILRTASFAVPAISSVFMITSPATVLMMTMPTWFLIKRKAGWEQSEWLLHNPDQEAQDEQFGRASLDEVGQVHDGSQVDGLHGLQPNVLSGEVNHVGYVPHVLVQQAPEVQQVVGGGQAGAQLGHCHHHHVGGVQHVGQVNGGHAQHDHGALGGGQVLPVQAPQHYHGLVDPAPLQTQHPGTHVVKSVSLVRLQRLGGSCLSQDQHLTEQESSYLQDHKDGWNGSSFIQTGFMTEFVETTRVFKEVTFLAIVPMLGHMDIEEIKNTDAVMNMNSRAGLVTDSITFLNLNYNLRYEISKGKLRMSENKLNFGYYEDEIGINSVSHFLEHEEWEITITFTVVFVVDRSTLSEFQQEFELENAADQVREVPLQLGGDHEHLVSSHTDCLQGSLQIHYEDHDRLPDVDGDTHQTRAGLQHQHVTDLYDELGSQQLHHGVPDKDLRPLLCLDAGCDNLQTGTSLHHQENDSYFGFITSLSKALSQKMVCWIFVRAHHSEDVARGVRDQHQHAQHLAQGHSQGHGFSRHQGQHSQHVGEEQVVTIENMWDIYTGPLTFYATEEITNTEMKREGAGQVPEVHDSQLGYFRHGVRGDGPEAGGDTHQSLVCGRPAARAALPGVEVPLVTTSIQESRFLHLKLTNSV